MSASSRGKVINLLCPSLSKFVPFVASEDQGVDVGTIARTFGVDPFTLRLNGHLIGRGVDLVSSLTWKSLLSFFAKKGVSTGKSHRDALIVDGKFSHHLQTRAGPIFDYGNEDNQVAKDNGLGTKRKPWSEDINSLKKRKMYECNLGPVFDYGNEYNQVAKDNGHSTKRKPWSEDINSLKKRKMYECNLGHVFDYGNEYNQVAKDNGLSTKRKPWSEDINSLKKRKMYECNLGLHKHFDTHERSEGHSFITKRKMQLEDVNLLKKRRMNQCIL